MSGRGERAQTGIDFLVGMSVFLIAVGFVFAFVPSMFAPFGGSGVNDALIADRSAAYLAEYALVENPANPGVLSVACTAVFFDTAAKLDPIVIDEEYNCNFNPEEIKDDDYLTTLFGLQNEEWKNIWIAIVEPVDVGEEKEEIEMQPANVIYENEESEETTIEMQRGDDPPSTGSDTVSQRVVSIDGEAYELRVRVW